MAVRAGQFLGTQVQMVLDGVLSPEAAQARYRTFVRAQRRDYATMLGFQVALLHAAP